MASNFFEKDLEDIIMENLDKIESRGFPKLYKNTERQVYLPNNGGKIDILSWEIVDNVFYGKIIELKKDSLSLSALIQAADYHLQILLSLIGNFDNSNVEVILIGSDYDDDLDNIVLLSNFLTTYRYHYNWDGIYFKKGTSRDEFVDSFYKMKPFSVYSEFIEKLRNPKNE